MTIYKDEKSLYDTAHGPSHSFMRDIRNDSFTTCHNDVDQPPAYDELFATQSTPEQPTFSAVQRPTTQCLESSSLLLDLEGDEFRSFDLLE